MPVLYFSFPFFVFHISTPTKKLGFVWSHKRIPMIMGCCGEMKKILLRYLLTSSAVPSTTGARSSDSQAWHICLSFDAWLGWASLASSAFSSRSDPGAVVGFKSLQTGNRLQKNPVSVLKCPGTAVFRYPVGIFLFALTGAMNSKK